VKRAKKLRIHTWPDELYDTTIVLLHGDGKEALAWMDKTFGDVSGRECGEFAGAKTVWIERDKGTALALWFPAWWHVNDGMYLSVLAHECFHAAEFVLRERGMQLTDASDEAYAYYIAWMFRNIYKRLAK
jgi:hypothetical protein